MKRLEAIIKRRILAVTSLIMVIQGMIPSIMPQRLMAAQSDSLTLTIGLADVFPPKPIDDLTAVSSIEGQASIFWTAPSEDSFTAASVTAVSTYEMKMAAFSVIGTDTTTWWNNAQDVGGEPNVPKTPGNVENMAMILEPGATYWFAIKSRDEINNESGIDTQALSGVTQAKVIVRDDPPPAPSNLAASASSGQVLLTWDPVNVSDLDFYRIHVDSTNPYDFSDSYQIDVDSVTNSHVHNLLTNGNTYAYRVAAVDKGAPSYSGLALQSSMSNTASAMPGSNLPNAPALSADLTQTTTHQIRWIVTDNAINEDGIFVFKAPSTRISGNLGPLPGTGAMVPYMEGGLSANTAYERFAETWNSVYGSSFSASVIVYTKANPPINTQINWVSSTTITLSWNANSNPGGTRYEIEFADNSSFSGATAAGITTSTGFTIPHLTANTNYWVHVRAINGDNAVSSYDDAVSTKTLTAEDTTPPEPPSGIWAEWLQTPGTQAKASSTGYGVRLHWSAVTENSDNTVFNDPAPQRYKVYRSATRAIDPTGPAPHSWTTDGLSADDSVPPEATYFYHLRAVDGNGNESKESLIIEASGTGELNIFSLAEDRRSRLIVPASVAKESMSKAHNKYGADVTLKAQEIAEEEKGRVIKSVRFEAMNADTGEKIKEFMFDQAKGTVVIVYDVQNGQVIQGTLGAPGAYGAYQSGSGAPVFEATKADQQLSLFWFNGNEWVKVGGTVDKEKQEVRLKTARVGNYQIRQALRVGPASLTLVYPRIFTPNGDGWNDKVVFEFDNPALMPLKGEIFDVTGAKVGDLAPGPNPDTSLAWDGKRNGQPVPSGAYIYQLEVGGETVTGTVIVAQ